MSTDDAAAKFDMVRAGEYEKQSRIALAGYDACHDLAACMLAAAIGPDARARVLVVGAGGGANEIVKTAALEPNWRFAAVDPSRPMLDLASAQLVAAGLMERTTIVHGTVADLAAEERFDAATLIGVLHHLRGNDAKHEILRSIALRLGPGAPLILACNHQHYASQPLLLAAWATRWRQQGAPPDEVGAKLATILTGADPPPSEQAVATGLDQAGFEPPLRFFASLFWGAWITRRRSDPRS